VTYGFKGTAVANDDIDEVRWFDISEFKIMTLMPEHAKLREMLFNNGVI